MNANFEIQQFKPFKQDTTCLMVNWHAMNKIGSIWHDEKGIAAMMTYIEPYVVAVFKIKTIKKPC